MRYFWLKLKLKTKTRSDAAISAFKLVIIAPAYTAIKVDVISKVQLVASTYLATIPL